MTERDLLVGTGTEEVPDVPKADRYELKEHSGHRYHQATTAWADRMRYLYREHVKQVEPQYGWKGPCEAIVPEALAADVRSAMDFVGSLVDYEAPVGDEVHVLLHSEGYWAHGFDGQ
jgi:hypothetical protein